MLKDKFPKNYAWEEPKCIKRTSKEECDNKCKRDQGRGNVDLSEINKHRLYSKSSPWLNAIDDPWMYKIDLEQVNLNLINTAEHGYTYRPLQRISMINFTK